MKERKSGKNKKPMAGDEPFEVVYGSGNVFRDFGDPNADLRQLQVILAARIMRVLDDHKLTVRQAQKQTGFAAADFSRIRSLKLERFTIDRLMMMLDRLGQEVDVSVRVRPRPKHDQHTYAAV